MTATLPSRLCAWCSTIFECAPAKVKKYCSRSCAVAAGNAAGNRRRSEQAAARRATATCETCGETFKWSGPRRKKRCSKRCIAAAHYAKHRDNHVERARAWRAEHPDVMASYWRQWEQENPMRYAMQRSHARARRRAVVVGPGVTEQQWADLLAEFDGRCAYCAADVPLTVDHVVPLARGGRDDADNVVPACMSCNCSKQDRPLAQWLGFVA